MNKQPQVEQGMHHQDKNQTEARAENSEESLKSAIEAITEQADLYKDAGMTQISAWLE